MDSDPVTDLGPLQPRGLCGYAELLLAYAAGEAAELEAVASLLGYQPEYRWPVRPPPAPGPTFVATGPQLGDAPDLPEGSPAAVAETPFWRLEQRTFLSPTGIPEAPPEPPPQWDGLPAGRPPVAELTRWNALLPRLRTGFAERADSTAPDIAAMIRRIETGRMLEDLPRLQRRRWGIGVQIIVDHSTRLIPFFEDQNRVALRLARLFPHRAVEHALALDGFPRPFVIGPHGKITAYRLPRPGTLVVALGDLGCLARNSRQIVADWEALGRRLSTAGCRPVALTPCPPSRWLPERLRPWTMVAWDRRGAASRFAQDELDERAERLLRLVSPAVRIEPGLLRDIRRLLGAAADAGTEADLWQHSDLMGRSSVAATLDPDAADRLRKQFARIEPPDLRVKVVETLRRWRGATWPRRCGSRNCSVSTRRPGPCCPSPSGTAMCRSPAGF